MRIILTLLMAFVLAACGTTDVSDVEENERETGENVVYEEKETEISVQTADEPDAVDAEIYPIVIYSHGMHYGYIIGGVVNHEFFSLEENLEPLSVIADTAYSFFTNEGKILDVECESAEATHVDATGTDEIVIKFENEIKTGMKYCSLGIGNMGQPLEDTEIITIDTAGTFEIDFDGDGKTERIVVQNDDNDVSVSLENQAGIYKLAKFTIDEIYTSAFEIFAADVTQNGNKDLFICLDGHDYSTEVFVITSESAGKALGYYMGN